MGFSEDFFSNHILIESSKLITYKQEAEIFDLVRQVLSRKDEDVKVNLITGINFEKEGD